MTVQNACIPAVRRGKKCLLSGSSSVTCSTFTVCSYNYYSEHPWKGIHKATTHLNNVDNIATCLNYYVIISINTSIIASIDRTQKHTSFKAVLLCILYCGSIVMHDSLKYCPFTST